MKERIIKCLRNSLLKKLLVSFIVFVLLPYLASMIYFYDVSKDIITVKLNDSKLKTLLQIKYDIETIITEVSSAFNVISQDILIQNIMKKNYTPELIEKLKDEITVKDILNNVKRNVFIFDAEVLIIDFNGNVYSTRFMDKSSYEQLLKSNWVKSIVDKKGYYQWFNIKKEEIGISASEVDNNLIAMGGLIKGKNSQNLGVMVIMIEESKLFKLINRSEINNETPRFIINESGYIVTSEDKRTNIPNDSYLNNYLSAFKNESGYYSLREGNDKYFISYQTINPVNWKLIEKAPYDDVFKEIQNLETKVLFIGVIIFAIFAFVLYFDIRVFITPVKTLQRLMKKVEEGNLDAKFKITSEDEIGKLGESFNSMVGNLDRLITENNLKNMELIEKEKTKQILKYKVLQSQISPHFLFNTLNAIKWMAMINDDLLVAKSITSLGHLLEASIKKSDDEITVGEEISYLQDYNHIMQLSYANKYEIFYEIDDEILNFRILKLILQPIVENSILHGILNIPQKGIIRVIGTRTKENLIFEVHDNGKGMDDTYKEELFFRKPEKSSKKFNSIGLNSVNQRIKLNYGEKYGINIKSQMDKGTIVTLYLPIIKNEE